MVIKPIKTRKLTPPQDDLITVLRESLPTLAENSIIAITSKIVSIWQGRCILAETVHKDELIIQEADLYLPRDFTPNGWVMHTIKENLFIPTAGIDTSNANGYYILWPNNPMRAAEEIRKHLLKKFKLKNLGILITDSHSIPLHRGAVGITLGLAGFEPIKDYRQTKDIFGHLLKVSVANIADCLSCAAVAVMGEGDEQQPLAVITDIPFVEFMEDNQPLAEDKPYSSFSIPIDEDLYGPFIKNAPWKKGGK